MLNTAPRCHNVTELGGESAQGGDIVVISLLTSPSLHLGSRRQNYDPLAWKITYIQLHLQIKSALKSYNIEAPKRNNVTTNV